MKNILVPTDLSAEANIALKIGVDMAKSMNGQVILLHVIDAPNATVLRTQGGTSGSSIDQIFTLKLIEKMKADMAECLEQFDDDAPIETEMVFGFLNDKIEERCERDDIDLIVIGTKGASGMHEVMVGSNAEKVVRSAKVPVLTVKEDGANIHPGKIVFASDFTENYDGVAGKLIEFQKLYNAQIHLLFVNTPNKFEMSAQSNERMKAFAEKYNLANYTCNIYNHRDEEDGILGFAEENDMDLISVATHSRKGLAHLLSGSIAEGIVNHSNKPVLSFSLKHMK